jgi:hypothetical protein
METIPKVGADTGILTYHWIVALSTSLSLRKKHSLQLRHDWDRYFQGTWLFIVIAVVNEVPQHRCAEIAPSCQYPLSEACQKLQYLKISYSLSFDNFNCMLNLNITMTDILNPPGGTPEPQESHESASDDPSKLSRYIPTTVKSIALGLLYTLPGQRDQHIYDYIEALTGICGRSPRRIETEAKDKGWNFERDKLHIPPEHLVDKPRSGRPNTAINGENTKRIIEIISKDRAGKEKSAEILGYELRVSRQSICRIMRAAGYKVKYTTKSGLNVKMKEKRLAFCRKYQHWTLEDWKNVIWSDETSVVLGQRRGSYRVWRKTDEGRIEEVTRKRWKGYSEFMFWG